MKRIFILILTLILVLSLTLGCTKKKNTYNDDKKDNTVINGDEESNKDSTDEQISNDHNNSDENELRKKYLSLAYEGKMDGLDFGIGDNGMSVITSWGEPMDKDYFLGGLYLAYEDVIFFTDGYIKSDGDFEYGLIVKICYIGFDEVYNLYNGLTITEVKQLLGEPDYVIVPNEMDHSELHGENFVAEYYTGQFCISLEYENESEPIHAIFLSNRPYRPINN